MNVTRQLVALVICTGAIACGPPSPSYAGTYEVELCDSRVREQVPATDWRAIGLPGDVQLQLDCTKGRIGAVLGRASFPSADCRRNRVCRSVTTEHCWCEVGAIRVSQSDRRQRLDLGFRNSRRHTRE